MEAESDSVGESQEEAKKMINIGKVKHFKVMRVGERKSSGSKGVIYGVPINVGIKDLDEHLEVTNNRVVNARRMVRGIEKKKKQRMFYISQCSQKKVYFDFIKYSVREYYPKPTICYKEFV